MRSGSVVLGWVVGLAVGNLAAGCGFQSAGAAADAGTADDGGSCASSFAMLLDTCALAFDHDLTLSGMAVYNTTMHKLTVGGVDMPIASKTVVISGVEVDVLAARTVHLNDSATLRGTGTRPLAIVASDSITLATGATIDVSDHTGEVGGGPGAGAQASCVGGPAVGTSDGGGGAGGGGGGFGADGGKGGDGSSTGGRSDGGAGGHAVGSVPAGLRGGCPGANGGTGNAPGGAGGAGGGALYLVAAGSITLDSSVAIAAAGGGGRGGQHPVGGSGKAGGGGGGSGGMLVLDASHVVATDATIAANGGGGGGGSDNNNPGGDGSPGSLTVVNAEGGPAGGQTATQGGRGGSRDSLPGDSVTPPANAGGGGGGGGVGIVRVLSADKHLDVVSPDPR
jgi:hypothetical protein